MRSARASLLPTACALLVVLGAALAAATHLTLGWRAFTTEDLETEMARHMLVEFPLRMALGAGLA